ncbi:hypothetical protein [Halospeciosus flavus]|uniref:Uncharacterized protein n=2 Tax=Halospeciosus flavus TaxID=3032283 RepID=A0ABD5Z172_9EURY|nr:hypothetical protein [Halospeciosus flavus]
MYNFWVRELDCVSCGHTVPLFKDYRVGNGRYDNGDKYNVLCPDCESVVYVNDWQSESSCTDCGNRFDPANGNVNRGKYNCPDCGQKYSVTDAVDEQGGYEIRLYALEYYCPACEEAGRSKSEVKGYKRAEDADHELAQKAENEWHASDDLNQYVPQVKIAKGAITQSSSISGNDLFQHGLEEWTDFYSPRQLLCLSTLLRSIDKIEDPQAREYLLLAFSDMLRTNNMMIGYQHSNNHINDVFQTNSFDVPQGAAEANVWGTEYGMGNFRSIWEMVLILTDIST